jgi:thiamine pyrophosphokinase
MDSLEEAGLDPAQIPDGIQVIRAPRAKDRTDTGLCLEYALQAGCSEAVVLGGLGGRLDHTLANLQDAAAFCARGLSVSFRDRDVRAWFVTDGVLRVDPLAGFSLSVFAWSPRALGVTLRNVAFPLTDHTLETGFPLGVSNGFEEAPAEVSVADGTLLVVSARLRGLDKAARPGI